MEAESPLPEVRVLPHYLNRELSWVRFNERVLEEAQDRSHPLLERLKFLAIFANNLDEFFMIRVAGLKEQEEAGIVSTSPDGRTPAQQLDALGNIIHPLVLRHADILLEDVLPKLKTKGIHLSRLDRLPQPKQDAVAQYFREKVFPILTPLAIDPAHPFPKLRSLGLNLLVELKAKTDSSGQKKIAVIPIPALLPRFYHFTDAAQADGNGASARARYDFVTIEQIIAEHTDTLFPAMQILSVGFFRVTRNADLDISEAEADDLLKLIERELRKRRLGTIIRLEVSEETSDDNIRFLQQSFGLEPYDVYRVPGLLGCSSLHELVGKVPEPDLKDEPFTPALHPRIARAHTIFDAIREQDILLHHPYDSFHPVVQFLEEAATDPNVVAIKQTLYRPAGRSTIANALREAALNGKQVTVLIELKARFDEENNITWARELERVGVNVVYGMIGLKIHGKVALVLRQEADGLRHYVHLSTGNYNEKTANIYTDLGLLTCRREFGEDVSELFNLLTGYSQQDKWRRIFVAPVNLRQQFLRLVHRCIETHTPSKPSRIRLVMNALVDPDMIEALYAASQRGVRVECIVRGVCCLMPGVPGVSDNISVRSIVSRFLEHARIYSFEYAGHTDLYLGSADWMPRNLNRRIEVAFPVVDEQLKNQVQDLLQLQFMDNQKARILQPDGNYTRRPPMEVPRDKRVNAQEYLLDSARERQKQTDTIYTD